MHPPLVSVDLWSSLLTVESSCGAPTSVCVGVGGCGVGGSQWHTIYSIILMRRLRLKV